MKAEVILLGSCCGVCDGWATSVSAGKQRQMRETQARVQELQASMEEKLGQLAPMAKQQYFTLQASRQPVRGLRALLAACLKPSAEVWYVLNILSGGASVLPLHQTAKGIGVLRLSAAGDPYPAVTSRLHQLLPWQAL